MKADAVGQPYGSGHKEEGWLRIRSPLEEKRLNEVKH